MTRTHAQKSAPTRSGVAGDDYLELVKAFPLRPLRSRRELIAAGRILDRYVGRGNLAPGQRDYVAALSHFVEDYEQQQISARLESLSPIDLLRHLMEENDMNTTDLGHVLGSRGLASEVLNGTRGLSKSLIRKLARRFAVDPSLFLGASEDA